MLLLPLLQPHPIPLLPSTTTTATTTTDAVCCHGYSDYYDYTTIRPPTLFGVCWPPLASCDTRLPGRNPCFNVSWAHFGLCGGTREEPLPQSPIYSAIIGFPRLSLGKFLSYGVRWSHVLPQGSYYRTEAVLDAFRPEHVLTLFRREGCSHQRAVAQQLRGCTPKSHSPKH